LMCSHFVLKLANGMGRPFDLPYSVEHWDDEDRHVEEMIALTGDYRVARAAFDEAVKRRAGRIVTRANPTAGRTPGRRCPSGEG
jgi:hypothetical protein